MTLPRRCCARPPAEPESVPDSRAPIPDRMQFRLDLLNLAGMPKIDQTRPFIPVRIAVLTVSDTRGLADDKSGDTLVEMIAQRRA